MIYTSATRQATLDAAGEENNPFVAWDNLGAAGTLGGTAVLTDGARANAFTGTTYDYWLPNVSGTSATLSVQFGAATSISFAGIAAHNLSDLGASVALEHSPDGVTWTDAGYGAATPADNDAIAFRIAATSRGYWRFNVTGLSAADPLYFGVAFLGDDLIFPRRFYQGFAPVIEPTEVQLQSNVSVGGNLLGSSVVSEGSTLSAAFQNVPASFVRDDDFRSFMRAFNRGTPFFFGWRPDKYAQDVHYCWRDGAVIRPDNAGPLDYMSVAMEARVYHG